MLAATLATAQTTLSTTLTGAQEVPAGDPDGSGVAVVRINGTTLTYTLLVTNIATPTGAHIHRGIAGTSSGIVVNLNPTFVGGTATGSVTVDQAPATEIATNPAAFYVNVHTTEFTDGAIRGQLQAPSAGAGSRVLYVPVVAKVTGAAGTNFVSDLRVINRSAATANVTLEYFQGSAAPSATKTLTVAPGEQRVLNDVIAFLGASGLGGLRVTADQEVEVRSRVINDLRATGEGTTGFSVNALQLSDAEMGGTLGFLSQSSQADVNAKTGFRTNIGYFNPSANAVTLSLTAHRSGDGAPLGTTTITVPAYTFAQQSAFAMIPGVPAADQVQQDFYVTWKASAPLYVYGSVVDNTTGDPVLIQ